MTLVQQLRSAGLRLERKSRDLTPGKLWLARHVPDPSILSAALPSPALRYASDATGLRGDYAVLLTDAKKTKLKAYALYAEAGQFMVVTRLAAASATAASAVVKLLKRIVHADRYSFLFMEGGVPKPMREGLARHTFGQHAGYGYVTDAALRDAERMLKQRMAATGRKVLPAPGGVKGSKAGRVAAQRRYDNAVKNGLKSVTVPTRFVENGGSNDNKSNGDNNGNARARRRPMLLTLRL